MNPVRKRLTLVRPISRGLSDQIDPDPVPQKLEAATCGVRKPAHLGEPDDLGPAPLEHIDDTNRLSPQDLEVLQMEDPWTASAHDVADGPAVSNGRLWTIDFPNGNIPKRLARRLQKAAVGHGKTIKYSSSLNIVARMFGHKNYSEMQVRFEMANPSMSDAEVGQEELEGRLRQYVRALTDNDFSADEARDMLKAWRMGPWLDFSREWVRADNPPANPTVLVSGTEFRDVETAKRLFGVLKRSIKAHGLTLDVGPRRLFANMFGHETYSGLLGAAALGNPSVPDLYLGPAAFDERVAQYLAVLKTAGVEEKVALSLLSRGHAGWWGISPNEWESLRQPRRAERLETGYRPRWRPRKLATSQR